MAKKTLNIDTSIIPTNKELEILEEQRKEEITQKEIAKENKKKVSSIVNITPQLHANLRVYCIKNSVTISNVFEDIIDNVLNNNVDLAFLTEKVEPYDANQNKMAYFSITKGKRNIFAEWCALNGTSLRHVIVYFLSKQIITQ